MSDVRIDPDHAARLARELLEHSVEKRVASVRVLVDAANSVDAANKAVKDATDAHAKAWADAIASGWSDKELRATGARAPGQNRARKTRQNRDAAPTETTEQTAEEHSD